MNKKYTQLYIINDISQLPSIGRKETSYVVVANRGIFSYSSTTGSVDYTGSIDGGYWNNIFITNTTGSNDNTDNYLQDGANEFIQDGSNNIIDVGYVIVSGSLLNFQTTDFQTTDFY
jgi:hypothetical protein